MNAPTSSSVPAYRAIRVAPNLSHAFGGIWRLTLARFLRPTHWLTIAGLCALLVLLSIPAAPNPAEAKRELIPWTVMFYLTFPVPVLAFIGAAGAIRDEMKAGNVDYVFTRPIPRPAFIGFKFLSHLACAQLDFLVSFATVVGIFAYREYPNMWAAVPWLLGAQLLIVTSFTALGMLCGILTSRFIVIGFAYGAIVEIGVGQIPTAISKLSMTHQVQSMLQPLWVAAQINPAHSAPYASVGGTITLFLGFTAILLFLASAIFSFMELSGPNEA